MIVDPYAGAGGWSEGLRALGLADIGFELDPAACATRAAAGHLTIRTDVRDVALAHLAGLVSAIIASPPCQSFSTAGNGDGRAVLDRLCAMVAAGDWGDGLGEGWAHVLEPGRWVEALRPEWVALEQVPPVLPVWQVYAERWRRLGYSCWAGVLNAADYGVPQTRQRAFLVASRAQAILPPQATHARGGALTMFGELAPWVSMADALGWPRTWEIAGAKGQWVFERPATTVCGDPRLSFPGHHDEEHRGMSEDEGSVRLTLRDALILQSFRPDYPVQGNKTAAFTQVGNGVPPRLAAHVLSAVTGVPLAVDLMGAA